MVAGRIHIKIQYEWTKKLKEEPYNCTFIDMEHRMEIGMNTITVDVYGKNEVGEEYVVEVGNVSETKYKLLKDWFKDKFIHIGSPQSQRSYGAYKESEGESPKISVRLKKDLLELIDVYAALRDTDRSKVINEFLKAGAQNKANMELSENFEKEQRNLWINLDKTQTINEGKNLIFARDNFQCRKCRGKENLIVYQIDKNPLNDNPMLQITLCTTCKDRIEKYSPKRRVTEDFIEWFILL